LDLCKRKKKTKDVYFTSHVKKETKFLVRYVFLEVFRGANGGNWRDKTTQGIHMMVVNAQSKNKNKYSGHIH